MAFETLKRLFRSTENRALSRSDLQTLRDQGPYGYGQTDGLFAFMNPGEPASKVRIDENTVLTISSVFAAVRAIAEDIARLTINVFELQEDGGKKRRTDHPLYRLLDLAPNPEMGSTKYLQFLIAQALLFGDGYSEIVTNDLTGKAIALWPIHNRDIKPQRTARGELYYEYLGSKQIPKEKIIHLGGLNAHSGILSEMTTRLGKEGFGLAKALETYGAAFFGSGARPGLIFTLPEGDKTNKEGRQEFLDAVQNRHGGASSAHKNAILKAGWKVEKIETNNESYQFLETRLFAIEEVARWFRIPPSKLAHLVKVSFNSIEHQSIEYVRDCLSPWITRLEEQFRLRLLNEDEQTKYDIKFDTRPLLMGDAKSVAEVAQIHVQTGIRNVDEAREELDLNPLPDGLGKRHMTSLNYTLMEQIGEKKEEVVPPAPAPVVEPSQDDPTDNPSEEEQEEPQAEADTRSLVESFRPMFTDEVSRILRVETDKVTRAAQKDGGVAALISGFYAKHPDHVRSSLLKITTPVAGVLRAVGVQVDLDPILRSVAQEMVDGSTSDLADPDGLTQRVEMWVEGRVPLIVDGLVSAIVDGTKPTAS